jgi:hypothetical protein
VKVGEKPLKVACFLFFIKDFWNALGRLVGGSQDKNKEKKNTMTYYYGRFYYLVVGASHV